MSRALYQLVTASSHPDRRPRSSCTNHFANRSSSLCIFSAGDPVPCTVVHPSTNLGITITNPQNLPIIIHHPSSHVSCNRRGRHHHPSSSRHHTGHDRTELPDLPKMAHSKSRSHGRGQERARQKHKVDPITRAATHSGRTDAVYICTVQWAITHSPRGQPGRKKPQEPLHRQRPNVVVGVQDLACAALMWRLLGVGLGRGRHTVGACQSCAVTTVQSLSPGQSDLKSGRCSLCR